MNYETQVLGDSTIIMDGDDRRRSRKKLIIGAGVAVALVAAAVAAAPPDSNSLYQMEAARIATASTQQLEAIKLSLRDLILLIRQREAQIQSGQ